MPDPSPHVPVLNGDGPPNPPAPGAAAVFQGMLSMLGEELESLNRGVAAVERDVADWRAASQATAQATAQAVAEQVERAVDRRLRELAAATAAAAADAGPGAKVRELAPVIDGRLERLEAMLADRVVQIPAAAVLQRLESLEESMVERIDALSPRLDRLVATGDAVEQLDDRVGRLEQALTRLVDQADLRSTTLASELQGVLAAGVERLVAIAARSEEATAAELKGTRSRVDAISTSLADLASEVSGMAEVGRRAAEEGRARSVLEAIGAASRQNGEVLAALHASISRRIDARVRAVGEMVEGLAAPLEKVSAAAAGVGQVSEAVAAHGAAVERVQAVADDLAAAVAAVPGGLAGALGRQEAALEQVRSATAERTDHGEALQAAFAGLESSIGQSLESVRSYLGEGLVHLGRRQAGAGKAMESASAALASMERRINDLAALCQSLASGVDQHGAASARVADLVLETRSALRADLERLEATVHLEAVKLHQQDQARLAGATSATTEVVEREAGLLAQRVSAVAVAVDSVRTVLHGHVEDASRVASAPLALVRDT